MSAAGHEDRNVAVLLTPPGSGAIAVIRLSGPGNPQFVQKHFSRSPKVGRCVYGDLRDGDEVIDDIVIVQSASGALDLNVHGGTWVTQAVLNLAEGDGYRIEHWTASAAVVMDAADEIERQMLLDLPAARSEAVLRLLAAQPAAWRAMLNSNDQVAMQQALADTALERALSTPTVAIVGPPNVGKSTLANALFGQTRSITADVPGTTRDWVGELADLDGLVVTLIDTPGVRDTTDQIEAEAISRAGHVVRAADVVVVAIDGSVPLNAESQKVANYFSERHLERTLFVQTKADLPRTSKLPRDAIAVSAARGEGVDELRSAIGAKLGCADLISPHARCWTASQRERLTGLLSLPSGGSTIAGE